jgi:hypothetical protein
MLKLLAARLLQLQQLLLARPQEPLVQLSGHKKLHQLHHAEDWLARSPT